MWGKLQLESVVDLIMSTRAYAATLPIEYRQSLPIPQAPDQGLQVAFLFCLSRLVIGEGAWLLPPGYQALVNAETAEFISLKAVTPSDFDQQDAEDKFLGAYNLPKDMTTEKYYAREARLLELYDALLPYFAAGSTEVPAEIKTMAEEFTAIFARISEPPLAPYYQAAGKEFFAWLRTARR